MQTIMVKVARLNGVTKEVTLTSNATVSDALAAAEMELGNNHLTVNGEDASPYTRLNDADLVMLATGAKGA